MCGSYCEMGEKPGESVSALDCVHLVFTQLCPSHVTRLAAYNGGNSHSLAVRNTLIAYKDL